MRPQSGVEALNKVWITAASLLVLALIAVLVGPYFIDWNRYKSTFESYASRLSNTQVRVLGEVDLHLLPEPRIRLTDVHMGADDAPVMTVGAFDMLVALTPLLSGDVQVLHMHLDRPKLNLTIGPHGTLVLPERMQRAERNLPPVDEIVFSDVALANGSVTLRDEASGSALVLNQVNLTFNAPSLAGPYKLDGSGLIDGAPIDLSIATGAWQPDDTLRVTTRFAPSIGGTAFSTDGRIEWPDDGEAAYDGAFKIEPAALQRDAAADEPANGGENVVEGAAELFDSLKVEGDFRLTQERLLVSKSSVSVGAEDKALAVDVVGSVDFDPAPHFSALVSAKQLDANRILGMSAADLLSVEEAFGLLTEQIQMLPRPGIPGEISLELPGLVVGGGIIRDLRFDATTVGDPGGWRISAVEAVLPGETTVSAEGRMNTVPDGGGAFDGYLHVTSKRPGALTAWWQPDAVETTTVLPAFELSGELFYGDGAIALSNAEIKGEGPTLSGTFTWQEGGANDRPSLFASFDADRVDLDATLALARSAEFALDQLTADGDRAVRDGSGEDPDDERSPWLGLPNLDIRFTLEELGVLGSTASDIDVEVSFLNDRLSINAFDVGSFNGASVTAKGTVENLSSTASGSLNAEISADDLTPLAELLSERLPAGSLLAWLETAAPALDATKVSARLKAAAESDGTRAELVVEGETGGSTLRTAIGFEGRLANWQDGLARLTMSATNDDGFRLARQLGIEPDPSAMIAAGYGLPAAQPGFVEVDLSGQPGQSMAGAVTARLFGVDASFDGHVDALSDAKQRAAEGRFTAGSDDIGTLWSALGRVPPFGGEKVPASVSALVGGGLDRLVVSNLEGEVDGQAVTGDLTLAKTVGPAAVRGNLTVARASLPALVSLAATPTTDALEQGADSAAAPWASYVFGEPAFGRLLLDLGLQVGALTVTEALTVDDAELRLALSQGELRIADFSGALAGGRLKGAADFKQIDGSLEVSLQAALDGARAERLLWPHLDPVPAAGQLDVAVDVDGLGRSVASVVDSLSGTGLVTLENTSIAALNRDAFQAVIAAVDAETLTLNEDALRDAFLSALDDGFLAVLSADAALTVNAGKIRLRNAALGTGDEILANATFDLAGWTLQSDWTLTGRPEDGNDLVPQAVVNFAGPLDAPERSVDVSPLVAFLTLRNVEKQVDTIEKLEADRAREEERLRQLQEESRLRREEEERQEAEARRRDAAEAAARARRQELDPITDSVDVQPSPAELSTGASAETSASTGGPLILVPQTSTGQPLNLLGQ